MLIVFIGRIIRHRAASGPTCRCTVAFRVLLFYLTCRSPSFALLMSEAPAIQSCSGNIRTPWWVYLRHQLYALDFTLGLDCWIEQVTVMSYACSQTAPCTFYGIIETKEDAELLVRACCENVLPFCTAPIMAYNTPGILSGYVLVYDQPAHGLITLDAETWEWLDYDGVFSTERVSGNSGFRRKHAWIPMLEKTYWVFSFYYPWHTVDGTLMPPTSDPVLQYYMISVATGASTVAALVTQVYAALKVCTDARALFSDTLSLTFFRHLLGLNKSNFERSYFIFLLGGQIAPLTILNSSSHRCAEVTFTGTKSSDVIYSGTSERRNFSCRWQLCL